MRALNDSEQCREWTADDRPSEECGVLAVSSRNNDAARLSFFGLYALQHRGQEAAGIAVADGRAVRVHKDMGLVSQVFESGTLDPLVGKLAIGHTRYSTTGANSERNVQPYVIETMHGPLGVAHNGNLVNADMLRAELLKRGAGLQSSSDSEVLALMLAAAEGATWEERLAAVMPRWEGAFCLALIAGTKVIAARDPWGFPTVLHRANCRRAVMSLPPRPARLRTVGCDEHFSEVEPGEIVVLQGDIARRHASGGRPRRSLARCTFEHIYFSRPGCHLGRPLDPPGPPATSGRSWPASIPSRPTSWCPCPTRRCRARSATPGLRGSPTTRASSKTGTSGGRSSNPPTSCAAKGVALKFNTPPRQSSPGKRVVMVDDSIVRGNTLGPLVRLVRDAGASEVHIRITCPPIAHPCFFGVDMGTYEQLIAHQLGVPEICAHIGADSLGYLSVETMMKALGRDDGYCNACFTGSYPIPVQLQMLTTKDRFDGVLQ